MNEAKIRHLFTYHRPSEAAVETMQNSRETLMCLALQLTAEYGESADLTVAIRSLHRASMEINYAIIVADEAQQSAPREHILNSECWCGPHVEHVEPEVPDGSR